MVLWQLEKIKVFKLLLKQAKLLLKVLASSVKLLFFFVPKIVFAMTQSKNTLDNLGQKGCRVSGFLLHFPSIRTYVKDNGFHGNCTK